MSEDKNPNTLLYVAWGIASLLFTASLVIGTIKLLGH